MSDDPTTEILPQHPLPPLPNGSPTAPTEPPPPGEEEQRQPEQAPPSVSRRRSPPQRADGWDQRAVVTIKDSSVTAPIRQGPAAAVVGGGHRLGAILI